MIVTVLDVGQGESLHLRYPDGRDALENARFPWSVGFAGE